MNLLVLGGTRFIGRAIVEAALQGGHTVSLFNRGTQRNLFPAASRIPGDRNNPDELTQISHAEWDAVIDVSGYRPSQVHSVLDALDDRFAHYVFVSTVSVYAHPVPVGAGEDATVIEVGEDIGADDPRAYGGLKVLCEGALRDRAGDRLSIVRPTVVIGPHDYTDRFPWWVHRVARGGRMEVPARLDQPVQLIDAGDLADFVMHILDDRILGTFNAVGPREPLTLAGMVEALSSALGTRVELHSAAAPEGREEFPLTLDPSGSEDGWFSLSGDAAQRCGLQLRPLAESALAVHHAAGSGSG